jgi:hypothetical protein
MKFNTQWKPEFSALTIDPAIVSAFGPGIEDSQKRRSLCLA